MHDAMDATRVHRIREAMEVAWRRPEPPASPLLLPVREQVAEAEARLARAQAAGDAKRLKEADLVEGATAGTIHDFNTWGTF